MVQIPPFFRDAQHVINSLRKWRPKETPLALHFIDIAVRELMEKRGEGAKMCLLLAQGLAEEKLRNTLMQLFCAVFHRHGPCAEQTNQHMASQLIQAVHENFEQIMEVIQQGGGVVELAPGCKASVAPIAQIPIKQPVNKKKKAKSLPPTNPWN